MFDELTLTNCLARKSLANGCQPKKLLHGALLCFVHYDKIINFYVFSCFYAVGVSIWQDFNSRFINLWLPYILIDLPAR